MGLLSRKTTNESEKSAAKEITVLNRLGLHARPAAMFVKVCNKHKSEIWVEKDGERVNGKSIMGLMMLAAGQGSKLRVVALDGLVGDERVVAGEQGRRGFGEHD